MAKKSRRTKIKSLPATACYDVTKFALDLREDRIGWVFPYAIKAENNYNDNKHLHKNNVIYVL